MFMTFVLALVVAFPQGQPARASLPDTAQGRAVQAFITAFNSGDEKTYLEMQQRLFSAAYLQRRSREERAESYRKLRDEIGPISVSRVVRATTLTIRFTCPTRQEGVAEMTFDFEEEPPNRIASLGVLIEARD